MKQGCAVLAMQAASVNRCRRVNLPIKEGQVFLIYFFATAFVSYSIWACVYNQSGTASAVEALLLLALPLLLTLQKFVVFDAFGESHHQLERDPCF
jgi:hypothetical protein